MKLIGFVDGTDLKMPRGRRGKQRNPDAPKDFVCTFVLTDEAINQVGDWIEQNFTPEMHEFSRKWAEEREKRPPSKTRKRRLRKKLHEHYQYGKPYPEIYHFIF